MNFGNCYTFNFNRTDPLYVYRGGRQYGLSVILYINQSDYMPWVETAGVRITVTPQDEWYFPDNDGSSVPVGFYSAMELGFVILSSFR